ncbi:hypothetical protein ACFYYB_27740 [Streptomyces sp. NPDC002886]|uniref:hypothetical protein n=1 Tax=Streptomyces sp. NPDC002886 TaxID=3364667 RepID=UPI0036753C36
MSGTEKAQAHVEQAVKEPPMKGNTSPALVCAYLVLFAGTLATVIGVVGILSLGANAAVYLLTMTMGIVTALAAWYVHSAGGGR